MFSFHINEGQVRLNCLSYCVLLVTILLSIYKEICEEFVLKEKEERSTHRVGQYGQLLQKASLPLPACSSRMVWPLPLLSNASGRLFPPFTWLGELAASVPLPSTLLKIICGLCVFAQYRLTGCRCVTAHTPSLREFKNKNHICNAKLTCSPFRAGWKALAPSTFFQIQFGPPYARAEQRKMSRFDLWDSAILARGLLNLDLSRPMPSNSRACDKSQ